MSQEELLRGVMMSFGKFREFQQILGSFKELLEL